jgi:DNA-binding NtrC family response regulator
MKPEQIKILVADADEGSSSRCAELLKGKGYHVDVANSPDTAIGKCSEVMYHLLITEASFVNAINGMELVKRVRDIHRQTCAILMTANPTLEGAVEAIRLGVCDYLAKPMDESKVIEAVHRSLSRRGIYLTNEETINKSIGARLRQLRREQGLTTQQLANRVGVTQSQISQVETGRSAASVVTLYKIAQAFEVSLAEMLEGV